MKQSEKPRLMIATAALLAVGATAALAQSTVPDSNDPTEEPTALESGSLRVADRSERGEHAERGEHGQRGKRSERGEHGKNGEHGQRGEHSGRGEHGERGEHGQRAGGRGGNGPMSGLIEKADADGNGSVTQDEIDAFRTAEVQRADTDGDGALDIDDFESLYREYTRPAMVDVFQNFDENGDGTIDTEEMDARFGSVVGRLDRDDDGALSVEDRGRGRRG